MKMKYKRFLSAMFSVFFLLGILTCNRPNAVTKGNAVEMSSSELVEQYFPMKELPLEVGPNMAVAKGHVISGKDKEQMFPYATDGDIHALARISFLQGHTTIVYREDWPDSDTYIVTFVDGSFSLENGQLIADEFAGEEYDGYSISTIAKDGTIYRKRTIDDGETFDTVSVSKIIN